MKKQLVLMAEFSLFALGVIIGIGVLLFVAMFAVGTGMHLVEWLWGGM